jgi:inhibitor of cysteine peptidase
MGASPLHGPSFGSLRLVVRPLAIMLGVFLLLLSHGKGQSPGAESGSPHVSTITLTRADSGKVVETRVGDTLVLRLDENPTTGYRWAMETRDEDTVALHSVEYVHSRSAGVGSGGQRSFTLRTKKAGSVTLQLKLWRAWEGDASIVERFRVTLQVQE